jgi:hypothetical protein
MWRAQQDLELSPTLSVHCLSVCCVCLCVCVCAQAKVSVSHFPCVITVALVSLAHTRR